MKPDLDYKVELTEDELRQFLENRKKQQDKTPTTLSHSEKPADLERAEVIDREVKELMSYAKYRQKKLQQYIQILDYVFCILLLVFGFILGLFIGHLH